MLGSGRRTRYREYRIGGGPGRVPVVGSSSSRGRRCGRWVDDAGRDVGRVVRHRLGFEPPTEIVHQLRSSKHGSRLNDLSSSCRREPLRCRSRCGLRCSNFGLGRRRCRASRGLRGFLHGRCFVPRRQRRGFLRGRCFVRRRGRCRVLGGWLFDWWGNDDGRLRCSGRGFGDLPVDRRRTFYRARLGSL